MSTIAYSCLLIGLDNAGKTSMLYNLKTSVFYNLLINYFLLKPKIFSQSVEIYPTCGFEPHTIIAPGSNKTILVYDCSGQGRNRDAWSMFFSEIEGLIYMIDSTDIDRLSIVKENIEIILNNSSFFFLKHIFKLFI